MSVDAGSRQLVIRAAESVVGRCQLVADHSWELGLAAVLELRTSSGAAVVAKRHADRNLFDSELDAYRRWVPAMGDRAPELLGIDDAAGVLVMSRLRGRPAVGLAPDTAAAVHGDAGALLRRLHDAAPAVPDPGWVHQRAARVGQWIADAPDGLLDRADVVWAVREVGALADLAPPSVVPCHGDWQPRNWLVDGSNIVRTFDFERARLSWWIHDLQRLAWQEWVARPSLAAAFFDGYGRRPDDQELAALWASSAGAHIIQIVWATRHGDLDFAAEGRDRVKQMRLPGARERFIDRVTSHG